MEETNGEWKNQTVQIEFCEEDETNLNRDKLMGKLISYSKSIHQIYEWMDIILMQVGKCFKRGESGGKGSYKTVTCKQFATFFLKLKVTWRVLLPN